MFGDSEAIAIGKAQHPSLTLPAPDARPRYRRALPPSLSSLCAVLGVAPRLFLSYLALYLLLILLGLWILASNRSISARPLSCCSLVTITSLTMTASFSFLIKTVAPDHNPTYAGRTHLGQPISELFGG